MFQGLQFKNQPARDTPLAMRRTAAKKARYRDYLESAPKLTQVLEAKCIHACIVVVFVAVVVWLQAQVASDCR
eukprot:5820123-Amphidinium_carterae.1